MQKVAYCIKVLPEDLLDFVLDEEEEEEVDFRFEEVSEEDIGCIKTKRCGARHSQKGIV